MLVGFSVHAGQLFDHRRSVEIAIAAVVIARVIIVAAARWVTPTEHHLPRGERLIMIWAGLRGALTGALALALPVTTPHRDLLITMAFGVVLFTLVVQGLTLSPLLRWAVPRKSDAHSA
jgi:CPA1 family monovalent cation:H+ antiporter